VSGHAPFAIADVREVAYIDEISALLRYRLAEPLAHPLSGSGR
jgi:hypothetical protein